MRPGFVEVSLPGAALLAQRIEDAVAQIEGGEDLRARMLLWEALGILAHEVAGRPRVVTDADVEAAQ